MKWSSLLPILLVIAGLSQFPKSIIAQLDVNHANKKIQENTRIQERAVETVSSKNVPLALGISLFIGAGIAFGLKKILDNKRKGATPG